MSKRILVAIDGSEKSLAALRFVTEEWPDAELTLVHVINPAESTSGTEGGFPGAVDQWFEGARSRGQEFLDEAAELVDHEVDTRVEVGRPARTIVDVAEDVDAELIVVGSQGRTGLSRVVLGSVAESVVRTAEVPVTVVR